MNREIRAQYKKVVLLTLDISDMADEPFTYKSAKQEIMKDIPAILKMLEAPYEESELHCLLYEDSNFIKEI